MRHYLQALIIASIAFYIAFTLVPTITIGQNLENLFIVIGGFLVTSIIIRPIFSLVLIPINFLTFGLLSLLLNFLAVFAYIRFLPGFSITAYNFPGADIQGFVLPAQDLNTITTIATVGIIITFVQKVLHIIFE